MNDEVRLLFHELADLSPGDRERVLAERQIKAEVRAEVEALLHFDSVSADGLTDCVSGVAADVLRLTAGRVVTSCGPYRLVRLLGSGGMGDVFLAERNDGEIQQTAAVKLLRVASQRPSWHDRFLKERQILASLNHPSIVRVIDAGHTAEGRPYLVMEYVEGRPIDEYAAEIEVRDRLALFLDVCDGVSHAHRHLVIHRDLKPSNILVDASGRPKLLDFGIAKLLDETIDMSQTVERLLTPNYSSPEQLRGGPQSTATDIYSLGAVLYKLLADQPPHRLDSQPSEIPLPSRLNPDIPADLDYVLRKALRDEPEERYASVEAFATDIRAFLQSRPVEARAGNSWYRARKFLRRYWVPVAAASFAVGGLAVGLGVANHERAIAQRRFQDVRQLSNKLFDISFEVSQLPGSTKARQLIVNTSLEYLRRLRADVQGDSELVLEVGDAYRQVAEVEGVSTGPNLGQADKAGRDLKIAEDLIRPVVVRQPGNREASWLAAWIAHDRMILSEDNGRDEDALAWAQKTGQWLETVSGSKGDSVKWQKLAIYANVARQYMQSEQYAEALRLCKLGNDVAQSRYGHPDAFMLSIVAMSRRYQGDLDGALQAARESVSLSEPGSSEIQFPVAMDLVLALAREGWILGEDNAVSLGRSLEAITVLERAFQIADSFVHKDQNDESSRVRLAHAGLSLAEILRHSDTHRALDVYDHILRHLREIGNDVEFRRLEIDALSGSSYPLRSLGQFAEAHRRLDRTVKRLSDLRLYPADKVQAGSDVQKAISALADQQAATGNLVGAIEVYRVLLERVQAGGAKPESSLRHAVALSHLWESLALLDRRAGRADLASGFESRRLTLWRRWDQKLPKNLFIQRQLRAAGPA